MKPTIKRQLPILATICVLGYAVAWFAMSGKP